MQQLNKTSTRKKFLLWGGAIFSSLTVLKFFGSQKREKKETTTVKMLTQDGKLVEVDVEKLGCGKRKKVSDQQLKNWVVKK